jgi:hypothetical protein
LGVSPLRILVVFDAGDPMSRKEMGVQLLWGIRLSRGAGMVTDISGNKTNQARHDIRNMAEMIELTPMP